ncbi:class I SAM-dependent methyltransferase [Roseiconus lacunae]|uniref:Class I SAM-dependent methyltransferase n=2 Tax=Roseiconus lacunae TaxID=2605694 RepID=A0ABT7PGP3_9BACT|nr:class I SAM-dependent methyltransferase [Roseiconus lacunae]MDM4015652.1 class I SAM-dependent methyltransferase [Roseiconus lacunae]
MSAIDIATPVTWESDYAQRVNPELMNRLLHQAVPVLQWTDWRITKVERGYCESILPLSVPTTNQHGTHQAALISLSADYTGGMALTTLLTGVPLTGIHRGHPDQSASLWLASMDVKYENPSTSHLRAVCRIDAKTADRIKSRYFGGRVVLATLTVEFFSEDNDRIAVAEMKYFAQATAKLLGDRPNGERSSLAKLNIKKSARIISGLRAKSGQNQGHWINRDDGTRIRVDGGHDMFAAGTHGILQAERLQKVLPQLQAMVAARTSNADEVLQSMPEIEQLIMLGAGLDMRPFRLSNALQGATVFELDLPDMLTERQHVIGRMETQIGGVHQAPERYQLAADFLRMDIGSKLRNHFAFSQTAATLVIYEGCSMYFDHEQNVKLLSSVMRSLKNPASRLWMDCVTPAVIDSSTGDPNIQAFIDQMEGIGEKFIHGPKNIDDFLGQCGLVLDRQVTAGDVLDDGDPTLAEYRFVTARRDSVGLPPA